MLPNAAAQYQLPPASPSLLTAAADTSPSAVSVPSNKPLGCNSSTQRKPWFSSFTSITDPTYEGFHRRLKRQKFTSMTQKRKIFGYQPHQNWISSSTEGAFYRGWKISNSSAPNAAIGAPAGCLLCQRRLHRFSQISRVRGIFKASGLRGLSSKMFLFYAGSNFHYRWHNPNRRCEAMIFQQKSPPL